MNYDIMQWLAVHEELCRKDGCPEEAEMCSRVKAEIERLQAIVDELDSILETQ